VDCPLSVWGVDDTDLPGFEWFMKFPRCGIYSAPWQIIAKLRQRNNREDAKDAKTIATST
jgi:hypothetical protein